MKFQDILKQFDEDPNFFPKHAEVIRFAEHEVSIYAISENLWLAFRYFGRIKTPHGNGMIVLPTVKNDDWNNRGFGYVEEAQYACIHVIAQMTKCITPEKNIEVHMEYQ